MRASRHSAIRDLLKKYPDGATSRWLAGALGMDADSVQRTLHAMPDAYIDRWDTSGAGAHAAVWMVVEVPENCPRPVSRKKKQ